jgi:hypothetical protein
MILKDGRSEEVQSQELKDRLRFNDIINPIVSALREVYGEQHRIGDIGVSFDGGRVTNLVKDAEGPFRLVPDCDPHLENKCSLLALALLKKKLTKMGFVTNEQKDTVVQEILVNRFYEDVRVGDTNNLSKLLALCVEEAKHGYNAVEVQQKDKQMQDNNEQGNMEEEDKDISVAIFEAFCSSKMVQDRFASLDGLGVKKEDETENKK